MRELIETGTTARHERMLQIYELTECADRTKMTWAAPVRHLRFLGFRCKCFRKSFVLPWRLRSPFSSFAVQKHGVMREYHGSLSENCLWLKVRDRERLSAGLEMLRYAKVPSQTRHFSQSCWLDIAGEVSTSCHNNKSLCFWRCKVAQLPEEEPAIRTG